MSTSFVSDLTIAMKVFQEIRETFPGVAMHLEDQTLKDPWQNGPQFRPNLSHKGSSIAVCQTGIQLDLSVFVCQNGTRCHGRAIP